MFRLSLTVVQLIEVCILQLGMGYPGWPDDSCPNANSRQILLDNYKQQLTTKAPGQTGCISLQRYVALLMDHKRRLAEKAE